MARTYISDHDFLLLCSAMRRRRGEFALRSDDEIAADCGIAGLTKYHIQRARRAVGWAKPRNRRARSTDGIQRLIDGIRASLDRIVGMLDDRVAIAAKRRVARPNGDSLQTMRTRLLDAVEQGDVPSVFGSTQAASYLHVNGTWTKCILDHLVARGDVARHDSGKARNGKPIFTYVRHRRINGSVAPAATISGVPA